MQTSIRKIGNSAGMTIPAALLKSLGLSLGDQVEIEAQDDVLVIKKRRSRPRYTLEQLLVTCDETQPMSDALNDWEQAETVGREVW